MPDRLLTIGELARRTGVATSSLRYWEDMGLMPPPARVSGQRRYPEAAAIRVGTILLLRDVGFSLAEQKTLLRTQSQDGDEWRDLARRKLGELDDQIAKATTARHAIEHGLVCPHDDVLRCDTFAGVVAARLAGQPLHEAHGH